IRRLRPDPGGGEAGRTSRLFGVTRDLARLDDRGWAVAGPSASSPLAASAAPAARLPGRTGADRRSEHAWFEDRGAPCTLLGFVDDATSRLMQLRFVTSESAFDYFRTTRAYLEEHG